MRFVFLLMVLVAASCSQPADLGPLVQSMGLAPLKETSAAPPVVLNNLQGEGVDLASLRGKVVVLNFWATWCGPCKAEWPSLVALQASLATENDIVFLSVDLSESQDVVKAYLKDNPANFPVLLDTDGVTGNRWGIQSIPTTVVIDKAGRLVAGKTGSYAWDKPEVLAGLRKLAVLP